MSSSIYSRQESLQLHIPEHVVVAGVGGVGSWAAILLTLSGVPKLSLFDMDSVEVTNLNRTLFIVEDIAHNKAVVMKEKLIKLRPEAIISAYPLSVIPAMLVADYNALIDCTDDWKVQRELYTECTKKNIVYIRAGYDGAEHFTVSSSVPGWHDSESKDESNERYFFTPSWSAPAVLTAVLAVAKLMKYKDMEVMGKCFEMLNREKVNSVSKC